METPPTARRFIAYMAGILLFGLFVVYPLSMGPAAYYLRRLNRSSYDRFYFAFYRPVFATYEAVPPLQKPWNAYVMFWIRLALDSAPNQPPPTPSAEP